MEKLNELEEKEIIGGGITGTILNAFTSAGKFIFNLGQAFGGGLRRIGTRNLCPLK